MTESGIAAAVIDNVCLLNRLLYHLACRHHHRLRQRPTTHRMVIPTQLLSRPSRESKTNQIESETEERLMRKRMGVDLGELPLPPSPGVLGVARGGGLTLT